MGNKVIDCKLGQACHVVVILIVRMNVRSVPRLSSQRTVMGFRAYVHELRIMLSILGHSEQK